MSLKQIERPGGEGKNSSRPSFANLVIYGWNLFAIAGAVKHKTLEFTILQLSFQLSGSNHIPLFKLDLSNYCSCFGREKATASQFMKKKGRSFTIERMRLTIAAL